MTGSLLYLFSREERARRRDARRNGLSPQLPPKDELVSPRMRQRPLSSFAPDLGRSAQRHQYQEPVSGHEQPLHPTLPTYDPSQYQPSRPTSMVDPRVYSHWIQPINPVNPLNYSGPSSQLSAVHYDSRLSIGRPVSMPYPSPPERIHKEPKPGQRITSSVREGRERSLSEPNPLDQAARPKQSKPVLSRLITNFR